jgi:putative ABC transport system ATP-binding protein
MPPAQPVVELHDVSKSYAEGDAIREVLSGVHLTLHAGEFVVLLGRSGSGKSTLLNLISGIDLPSRGTVRVDGRELVTLSEHQRTLLRRERIGFIFQSFNLLPTLTVEENVLLPLELTGREDSHSRGRVRELLDTVGLGNRAGSFPDRLSGGEQQRVAVARAFVNRPAILLADEPTGNLDPATSVGIMRLLDRINRTGTTIVMATHDDEIVDQMRKRVVEMEDGRLVRDQDRGVYGYTR